MAPECPDCGGTGFRIRTTEQGFTAAERCDCSFREQASRLLKSARIPPRYDHCLLETFEGQEDSHREAIQIAGDWVERWPDLEFNHSLLFHGTPGIGKTHLAIGIIRQLALHKGARVLFYEQRALLKKLQGTFDPTSAVRESHILAPIQAADILVLDDLGAGRTSEWARDVLHEIITHRYDHRKSMIITTNCALGDGEDDEAGEDGGAGLMGSLSLRQRLGDALMSRLYEMCRFVHLEGDDYRKGVINEQIRRV